MARTYVWELIWKKGEKGVKEDLSLRVGKVHWKKGKGRVEGHNSVGGKVVESWDLGHDGQGNNGACWETGLSLSRNGKRGEQGYRKEMMT